MKKVVDSSNYGAGAPTAPAGETHAGNVSKAMTEHPKGFVPFPTMGSSTPTNGGAFGGTGGSSGYSGNENGFGKSGEKSTG